MRPGRSGDVSVGHVRGEPAGRAREQMHLVRVVPLLGAVPVEMLREQRGENAVIGAHTDLGALEARQFEHIPVDAGTGRGPTRVAQLSEDFYRGPPDVSGQHHRLPERTEEVVQERRGRALPFAPGDADHPVPLGFLHPEGSSTGHHLAGGHLGEAPDVGAHPW